MHNNIIAAGLRGRPPMLATGRYAQWQSHFLRYIDTRPNGDALRKCILEGPYQPTTVTILVVPVQKPLQRIILTGIDNDIYSTVDACPNACEMWKAIERLKQAEGWGARALNKDQFNHPQNHLLTTLKIPQPNHNKLLPETEDKEIDKLIALISLSFKKIYKSTNNNLRTSSNTSRANQDNTPRINRGTGYDNQRVVNVAGARENVGTPVLQQSGIQCYNCKEYGHVARECQKPKRAK
ncbi:retrovirus-related pol polyprotein from transposon TNT 1-94 [Tanacetum coccineum]